jgi:hypothetical protein
MGFEVSATGYDVGFGGSTIACTSGMHLYCLEP